MLLQESPLVVLKLLGDALLLLHLVLLHFLERLLNALVLLLLLLGRLHHRHHLLESRVDGHQLALQVKLDLRLVEPVHQEEEPVELGHDLAAEQRDVGRRVALVQLQLLHRRRRCRRGGGRLARRLPVLHGERRRRRRRGGLHDSRRRLEGARGRRGGGQAERLGRQRLGGKREGSVGGRGRRRGGRGGGERNAGCRGGRGHRGGVPSACSGDLLHLPQEKVLQEIVGAHGEVGVGAEPGEGGQRGIELRVVGGERQGEGGSRRRRRRRNLRAKIETAAPVEGALFGDLGDGRRQRGVQRDGRLLLGEVHGVVRRLDGEVFGLGKSGDGGGGRRRGGLVAPRRVEVEQEGGDLSVDCVLVSNPARGGGG